MSEEDKGWIDSLLAPSVSISAGAIVIGSWMLILTIINIVFGAFSEGRKINWLDFITNGSNTNSAHTVTLTVPDDLVFAILSVSVIGAGIYGMGAAREGGFSAWVSKLPGDRIVTSLFSAQGGLQRTLASWLILIGAMYYFIWSAFETTWVDPGVYSVMVALVSIGIGIHWIEDSSSSG